MADRGLEQVDLAALGAGEVNLGQFLQRQIEFLIQLHDYEGIETVNQRGGPAAERFLIPTSNRSQFILRPSLLLVPFPGMQECLAHLRQALLSLRLQYGYFRYRFVLDFGNL
jgi:hypothetical protein